MNRRRYPCRPDVAMKSIYAKEAIDPEMLISGKIINLAGILANDHTLYQSEGGSRTMCTALEEIRDEGRIEGRIEGREEGIQTLILTCRDLGIQKALIIEQLKQKCDFSEEEALQKVDLYWTR